MFYYSRLKTVCAIVTLLLSSLTLFAQNNLNSSLFTNVEAGSKIYYSIKMQNGTEHKARIVSVDPDKVLLLLPGNKSLTINTGEIIEIKKQAHNSVGSVGLGFGIPYGLLGANLDISRSWGLDFDIIYIVDDSELESRLDYLIDQGYNFDVVATGNIKISLGLRYIF